jgi:2-phospho-L-lactate/phosphoenolpyruvate guanylyltransferase
MSVVAIIPFRSLDHGKTRLSSALSPALRRALCRRMLQRTLRIAASVARVMVISDDPRVAAIVHSTCSNALFLRAAVPGDLNVALNEAREATPWAQSIVVVPTDLPLLDRATLRRFVAADGTVGIAADRWQQGTNLLFLPHQAKSAFRFGFGPGSLDHHTAEAQRLGLKPRFARSMRTAFDLDTPADLAEGGRHKVAIASLLGGPAHP